MKKSSGGRSRWRNPRGRIGSTFHITHEPVGRAANREPLGGSRNQFQFVEQRGVVDSSLRADSIVPLAHAVVVLTAAGPCQRNFGDPRLSRARSRRTRGPGTSGTGDDDAIGQVPLIHCSIAIAGLGVRESARVTAVESARFSAISDRRLRWTLGGRSSLSGVARPQSPIQRVRKRFYAWTVKVTVGVVERTLDDSRARCARDSIRDILSATENLVARKLRTGSGSPEADRRLAESRSRVAARGRETRHEESSAYSRPRVLAYSTARRSAERVGEISRREDRRSTDVNPDLRKLEWTVGGRELAEDLDVLMSPDIRQHDPPSVAPSDRSSGLAERKM